MTRFLKITLCCSVLLLTACSSTTFVYNRLDFLLGWYVDDYVDLTREQDQQLERSLQPFLQWHRLQELPRYIAFLDDVQARLERPVTAEDLHELSAEIETSWLRLQDEALAWLLELGESLSARQVVSFNAYLQEQQDKYSEKYLDRSDKKYRQDSYENLLDNLQDYLGRLDRDQRDRLRAASAELRRSDSIWLQERAAWLQQLEVLLQREPLWQQRLRDAIDRRDESVSSLYRETLGHNMQVVLTAIADVLNSRTPKQDARLRRELDDLREDLQTLVAQGLARQASSG